MNALLSRTSTTVQDVSLLLARAILGVVLVAHGWQKVQQGVGATADGFASMGIPAPEAAAWFAIATELVGGVLLVAGLATRVVAALVVATMAGAFWFAHRGTEVFVAEGGWELVGVIGAAGLALVGSGAGRLSIDGGIARSAGGARRATERTPEREPELAGSATGSARRS